MAAGDEPAPPPSPDAPPALETSSLGRAAAASGPGLAAEDDPTLAEPGDASTESGALAELPDRTVTAGAWAAPAGALAVTLVEPAEGAVAFTVTVGAFGDGASALTGAEGLFSGTVGVVALLVGALTETDGAFADTVGVVTVAPLFVVEADGAVTEMLGTVTVPTSVFTGTVGVPMVTEGRLSDDAVGTCASASTSAEAKQSERAFFRDSVRRAIHNS